MQGITGRTCATCGVELARLQADPLCQGNHTAVTPTPLRQQDMLARRLERLCTLGRLCPPSRPKDHVSGVEQLARVLTDTFLRVLSCCHTDSWKLTKPSSVCTGQEISSCWCEECSPLRGSSGLKSSICIQDSRQRTFLCKIYIARHNSSLARAL